MLWGIRSMVHGGSGVNPVHKRSSTALASSSFHCWPRCCPLGKHTDSSPLGACSKVGALPAWFIQKFVKVCDPLNISCESFPACNPFLSVQRVSYWKAPPGMESRGFGTMRLSPDELVLNSENVVGSCQSVHLLEEVALR